jgi:hypothetical protein
MLCGLVLGGSAQAADLEVFKTSSGNIVCELDNESRPSTIGPITLEVKQTGERSAGNPHAAFDVAGVGNVARSR